MEINFSNTDVIFIYGTFKKKVEEIEKIKNTPGCPFSNADIQKEIQIYTSVMDKLKDAVPGLAGMDKYKFNL